MRELNQACPQSMSLQLNVGQDSTKGPHCLASSYLDTVEQGPSTPCKPAGLSPNHHGARPNWGAWTEATSPMCEGRQGAPAWAGMTLGRGRILRPGVYSNGKSRAGSRATPGHSPEGPAAQVWAEDSPPGKPTVGFPCGQYSQQPQPSGQADGCQEPGTGSRWGMQAKEASSPRDP